MTAPDDDLRLMRLTEVLELVPVSEATLYRMVKRGEFPRASKIGGQSFWPQAKVRNWLRDKVQEGDELI